MERNLNGIMEWWNSREDKYEWAYFFGGQRVRGPDDRGLYYSREEAEANKTKGHLYRLDPVKEWVPAEE